MDYRFTCTAQYIYTGSKIKGISAILRFYENTVPW